MLTSVVIWVGLIPVGILSICIALCCVVYYSNRYVVTDIFSISLLLILLGDCVIITPIECIVRANSFQPPMSLCQALLWFFITFRVVPVMYVLWMLLDRLVVLKPFVSVLRKESVLFGTNRSAITWTICLFVLGAIIGSIPFMYVDSNTYTGDNSCNIVLYSVDWHFATFITLFEISGFTLSSSLLVKLFIKTIHVQQRAGKRGWRKQNFVETINMRSIEDPTSYMENCKLLICVVLTLYLLNHLPHGILTMLGLLSGGDAQHAHHVVIWLSIIGPITVPIALVSSNKRYRVAIAKITSFCRCGDRVTNEDNVFSTNIHFDPNVTVISSNGDNPDDPDESGGVINHQFEPDQTTQLNHTADIHQPESSNQPANSCFLQPQNGAYNNPAFNDASIQEQTNSSDNISTINERDSEIINNAYICHVNNGFDDDDDENVKQLSLEAVSGENEISKNGDVQQVSTQSPKLANESHMIIDLPTDFTIDPGVTYKSSDYHPDYLSDDVSMSESDQFSISNLNEIDPVKPSKKKRRRRRPVQKLASIGGSIETTPLQADNDMPDTRCITSDDDGINSFTDSAVLNKMGDINNTHEPVKVEVKDQQNVAPYNDLEDYIELCSERDGSQYMSNNSFYKQNIINQSLDLQPGLAIIDKERDCNGREFQMTPSISDRSRYNNNIQDHARSKENWRSTAIILSAVDYLNNLKHEHLAILDDGHVFVTSESESEALTLETKGQQDTTTYLKTYTTDFF